MNWHDQVDKEILDLKIKETELSIQALQTKLRRLKLEREEWETDIKETKASSEERTVDPVGEEVGIKDAGEKDLSIGHIVELLTSSKGNKSFQKGTQTRVEGRLSDNRVLVSHLVYVNETTNRIGKNLRIKGRLSCDN